ncbi:MAG: hypothetical protein K0S65_4704 [Labilithrix sp.]|nr:hypothetical protein [Labilithrix sp.]
MPSPKYPLKPLLEHRERQVDDATTELGHAVRARESADAARGRAEIERREAEERAAGARVELARKMADRDVVAKDESRFVDRVKRHALAAEEEAAEEAFRGGRR